MAASNYRYLFTERNHPVITDNTIFELDESDVWNMTSSPEFHNPVQKSRVSKKTSSSVVGGTPSSLPVNVPDWSKILKQELGQSQTRRRGAEFEEFEYGERVPPHEFLARQSARTTSFSVHEGIGRTLKGRDLSRVRNAVWEKIGFQD